MKCAVRHCAVAADDECDRKYRATLPGTFTPSPLPPAAAAAAATAASPRIPEAADDADNADNDAGDDGAGRATTDADCTSKGSMLLPSIVGGVSRPASDSIVGARSTLDASCGK